MFANKTPEATGFHGYCTFFKNGTCQIHENCIYSLDITHIQFHRQALHSRCSVFLPWNVSSHSAWFSVSSVLKPISRDHTGCLSFSHSIPKSVMPANPPCFQWEQSQKTRQCSLRLLQKCQSWACISNRLSPPDSSATRASSVMLWMTIFLFQEWKESLVISCCPMGASDENEDRTETWGSGQGTSSLCTERQSPLWVQPLLPSCTLQDFLWSHLPKTLYWHRRRSPAITTWASFPQPALSGPTSKCSGTAHAWHRNSSVPRPTLSWSLRAFPSGSQPWGL